MADKLSDEQIAEWDDEWEAELRMRRALRDYDGWEWFGRKTAYIAHKAYRAGQEVMRERAAGVCKSITYSGYCPPEDGAAPDYYNNAAGDCAEQVLALPISEE